MDSLPKPYYDDEARGIVIYHADCRELLPLLPKVDLLLTDPPYGVLSQAGSAATRRSSGNLHNGICDWDIVLESDIVLNMLECGADAAIWGGVSFAAAANLRVFGVG